MAKSADNDVMLAGGITVGELQSVVGIVVKIARLATWRFFGAFAFGTAARYFAVRYISDGWAAGGAIVAAIIAGALLGLEIDAWMRRRSDRRTLERLVLLVRDVMRALRERAADAAGLNPVERKELAKLVVLITKVSPDDVADGAPNPPKPNGARSLTPEIAEPRQARDDPEGVVSAREPAPAVDD
ncbi:MAG TPA: hypothetical protein VGM56_24490 [Byssovorax sp.]|jgi:hypothetical protein